MKTSVAYDKLCDTLPIIKGIVDKAKADPAILEQLKAAATAKSRLDYLVAVPPILKSCKEEVFAMLAVWNGKSVEEIEAQEHMVTVMEVMNIFVNKDLMDFLSPAQGNAQESTEQAEPLTSSEPTEAEVTSEATESVAYEVAQNSYVIE